jgi:signal transduction histidine kinase
LTCSGPSLTLELLPVANATLAVPAILIVDDNRSNLVALEAALQPVAFDVVAAQSGAEALERIAARDFVTIVMDVHMPGLDGYQTTAMIRRIERSRDVPVIFLTAAYNEPEHTRRGYALGAVDYIVKPFDAEVLQAKIKALVSLYLRGERSERERSEAAERMKAVFLGAVGHDLRDPLNTILMASQMMLRGKECSDAGHAAAARRIGRSAERMNRIIEDILDLTRSEVTGSVAVRVRPADLGELCRTVVDECRIAHPGRVIELDARGDLTGRWDPDRLVRVASNLLGNAIAHSAEDPIRVSAFEDGKDVVLVVHNRGAPIDDQVLPTLFAPFRRGKTTARGLGLGLYIVRQSVLAHHGRVDVKSTAVDGTSFTVVLPREPPAAATHPPGELEQSGA